MNSRTILLSLILTSAFLPARGPAGATLASGVPPGRGALTISIEVLPGVAPKRIQVGGGQEISVAVLSIPALEAGRVDGSSLCFGDADDPAARDCTEEHGGGHLTDVDGDGDADLLLHYQEPETGIDPGDTRACLHGTTADARTIEGCGDIVAE